MKMAARIFSPILRYKKMKCHDQVTIGCQWHPIEASRFATCSWDGTIKYWD
jgi:pre-mRNA-processing factor 17